MTRPIRHDLVRAAILEVYASVRLDGRLADRALEHVLRRESRLFSHERREVAESVWALLRLERRIDWLLTGGRPQRWTGLPLIRARVEALPQVRAQTPPYPWETLPILDRIGIEGSLPEALAARLLEEWGPEEALGFVQAIGERGPLTLRLNTLRGDRATLIERLEREGVRATPTRFSPLGLTLETHQNAFALPSFREGWFEIQDEGSQLLAQMVEARPGEKIADACAGAGGKTLALAAQMANKGELWAFDIDAPRLEELARRARRAQVFNLRVQPLTLERADVQLERFAGRFHRVLVDAPCSGFGALRRNPDARYRIQTSDFETFPKRQLEILERSARLLRPGGRLVYATCSIARSENDVVVEKFLSRTAGFRPIEAQTLLPDSCGATIDGPFLRLFPHRHGTDGFFAAAFART